MDINVFVKLVIKHLKDKEKYHQNVIFVERVQPCVLRFGVNKLYHACHSGNLDIVELMISKGTSGCGNYTKIINIIKYNIYYEFSYNY